MIRFVFIVGFASLLVGQTLFAQKPCNCNVFSASEDVLDSLIDVLDLIQTEQKTTELIEQNNEVCKVMGYYYLTLIHLKKAQQDSALTYINLQEEILKQASCKNSIANYLYSKGLAEYHFLNNDYENALDFSLKSLEVAQEIKDPKRLAEGNLKVASILMRMKLPERYRNYVVDARKNIDLMPESNKKYMLYTKILKNLNTLILLMFC